MAHRSTLSEGSGFKPGPARIPSGQFPILGAGVFLSKAGLLGLKSAGGRPRFWLDSARRNIAFDTARPLPTLWLLTV